MPMSDIAPMVVAIVLILTIGGVAVLRPLSRQLAQLLAAVTDDRRSARSAEQAALLREMVAGLEARLDALEERQGFTESLLAARTADEPERLEAIAPSAATTLL